MIDELLRRAGITTRAEELEGELDALREEKSNLEDQLEAEQRRRSEAARDRQAAEEEVNRLEDRIAQLEGTVSRLRDGDAGADRGAGGTDDGRGERGGRGFRGQETLRRGGAERVLERLQSVDASPEGACTAVVADQLPESAREAFGPSAPLVDRAAPCIALTDDDGLVSAALRPPVLPGAGVTWADAFRLEREHLLPTGEFALALVRSDLFALGEYRGTERIAVRGFESDVKGDHSKGGFSQGRFERRRDEQVEEHLADCEAALAERDAERLYVVGHRAAIDALDVAARATAAVDATGDPEAALDRAFDDFWTTRLFLL